MTTPNGVARVVGAGDGLGSAIARRGGAKLEAAVQRLDPRARRPWVEKF